MSASAPLFALPAPDPELPDTPLDNPTAEDVKAALRRRHPGDTHGSMPGQWTCIEEWIGIDLLALNAWQKADVIGYEVKVSRSDLRRELLKPHKRARALAATTEFYFAVPAGLLSDEEVAYEEPEWEDGDFERTPCSGVPEFGPETRRYGQTRMYGGRCARWDRRRHTVPVPPGPEVVVPSEWARPRDGETTEAFHLRVVEEHFRWYESRGICWTCGGKGYTEKSRVEQEAPTVWVPRDVGLVTVSARGCRVVKQSPKRKDPKSLAPSRQGLNDLVRWVSHRPDPRHR